MKRSDALNRIYQYLKDSTTISAGDLMDKSKALLKLIETDLKMVPPAIEEKSYIISQTGDLIHTEHEWEKE